ncbi:hypothetical protein [Pumilibacter muris]|jgi:esterase/lipase|uniref:hypothetical protein n=1 Tax=Pumilibacter muris TaxID=2941510 RepID=UPI0020420BD7|nr:hypothetical protein [Pumilibacter muris]
MILSPKRLWENYDRSIMPLDTSVIRSFKTSFGTEKHVYYNGEATSLGCTRIYARLLLPENSSNKLVLAMLGADENIHDYDFSEFIKNGWAVLAVDYVGNAFERERFTIYPPSLGYANYNKNELYTIAEHPQKTCWYVWTTVCLRSFTFAESEGFSRVAALGVNLGGSTVIKAAALSDFPVCAASLFSPGFFPPSDDVDKLSERVSVSVDGYAHMYKIPFFQICCSNDVDSSLDRISELNEQAAGKSLLYIAPRVAKSYTKEIQSNINLFFSEYLDNSVLNEEEKNIFAPSFDFSASGAEDKMYFSLKCSHKLKEVSLFVSHGITNPAYRNWRAVPLEKAGEDEYLGYTQVYSSDKTVYSFACLTTENGFIYSTPVLKKVPSSLKIKPTVITKRRLIYDSDMGVDDFFAAEEKFVPEVKEGPFSIGGISASKGLCTYKLGDVAFSGSRDSVLQLLMFSPVAQEVTFSVTDEEHFTTYSCKKFISPETDWTKIMLQVSDLKSNEGYLSGWDKAILLRIDAEEEVLISSLLWV